MTYTQEDLTEWCKEAYERGFTSFEFSHVPNNLDPESVRVMINEDSEYKKLFWDIEDSFGFERGKHDWDNFGIYGLIEDCSVCFEAGANDALENKEYNPQRVSHMWGE